MNNIEIENTLQVAKAALAQGITLGDVSQMVMLAKNMGADEHGSGCPMVVESQDSDGNEIEILISSLPPDTMITWVQWEFWGYSIVTEDDLRDLISEGRIAEGDCRA